MVAGTSHITSSAWAGCVWLRCMSPHSIGKHPDLGPFALKPQARPRQAHNKKTQSPQLTTRDMSGLYVSAESMLLEFRINVA